MGDGAYIVSEEKSVGVGAEVCRSKSGGIEPSIPSRWVAARLLVQS